MTSEQLQPINLSVLSAERRSEVLLKIKLEFARVAIFNPSFSFITMVARKCVFKKLMEARTLREYAVERTRLSDENIYLGSYYEDFTKSFVGLTREELCALGLEESRIEELCEADRDWTNFIYNTLGEEKFIDMYGSAAFRKFALKLKKHTHVS